MKDIWDSFVKPVHYIDNALALLYYELTKRMYFWFTNAKIPYCRRELPVPSKVTRLLSIIDFDAGMNK